MERSYPGKGIGKREGIAMVFDCVVVACHLRFDGVWQRPQHLITRLARRVPVLFVEEPFLAEHDRTALARRGNVTVLRPERKALDAAMFDPATTETIRDWTAGRRPLLWLYTPSGLPLVEFYPQAPLVYDRMDDLASFAFAAPDLAQRERSLLRRAGLVFAGGRSLYERSREFGDKVRLFPSGVEFEHFAAAATTEAHPLFAHLAAPVCGYAGVIDERIDFGAIAAVAACAVEVVLVGPVTKIDGTAFPRRTNVHFTGGVPYRDLPAFVAGFDVALLPFALNAATRSISPTKTPEYLAAGKPVVSTPIADVVSDYGDIVRIADGPAAFAAACVDALTPDARRSERGTARAMAAGWDATFARMWNDLERE